MLHYIRITYLIFPTPALLLRLLHNSLLLILLLFLHDSYPSCLNLFSRHPTTSTLFPALSRNSSSISSPSSSPLARCLLCPLVLPIILVLFLLFLLSVLLIAIVIVIAIPVILLDGIITNIVHPHFV